MANSDYLLKAAIKKVTEKLNTIFAGKIEEVSTIAQDVPEIIKKELETLKVSIIEEALRMEKETKDKDDIEDSRLNQNPKIKVAIEKMEEIKKQIEQFNKRMNKQF